MQANSNVVTQLVAADKAARNAAKTVTAKCKAAAESAIGDVTGADVKAQYEEVKAAYADTLKPLDKNVRATFMAFVLCALCPTTVVELSPPKGEADAVTAEAQDISSKTGATIAAAQIREAHGMASSNNRKPKATVPADALTAAGNIAQALKPEVGFSMSDWSARLPDVVKDPVRLETLTASLRALGFELLLRAVSETKKQAKDKAAAPASTDFHIAAGTPTHPQHA